MAEDAKSVLLESPLARAKTNVIRNFVLGITANVLKGDLSIKEVLKRNAAIRATSVIHRDYFLELIRTHFPDVFQKSEDGGLKYLLMLLRHIPEMIEAVTEGAIARMLRYIETAPEADIPIVVQEGLNIPIFRESVSKKLVELDENALSKVIGSGLGAPPLEVIEKAFALYAKSGSYSIANQVGKKAIQPLLSFLSKAQVLNLFEIADTNTEIQGSYVFPEIMNEIKTSGILTERDFRSEMQKRAWDQFLDDENGPPPNESETALF